MLRPPKAETGLARLSAIVLFNICLFKPATGRPVLGEAGWNQRCEINLENLLPEYYLLGENFPFVESPV
jgi:hypothetical protein